MNNFKNYANSFQAVANLDLLGIKKLCEILENPEKDLKFIHVAGTNGKGSVCAFLQTSLTKAGYKTGKYISPNLIKVNERISIDGKDIFDDDLERLLDKVKKACDIVYEELNFYPTQFEIWTAVAFLYFKEKSVDYVILETGLGGEKDATNVVKNTICSVITKISFDHMGYLGNSIEEIASAKAGIIKKNSFCVSLKQDEKVLDILKKEAKLLDNEFILSKTITSKGHIDSNEIFDYLDLKDIICSLSGVHQLENVGLAITVLEKLGIEKEFIRFGIENAKNPARFEILRKNPYIIFDGAHNCDGILSLCKNINKYFPNVRKNFIFGVMADKEITEIIDIFKKYNFDKSSIFYTVKVKDNERAMDAEKLANILKINGFNAFPKYNTKDALFDASFECDCIFIIGSLYLYKDLMEENRF